MSILKLFIVIGYVIAAVVSLAIIIVVISLPITIPLLIVFLIKKKNKETRTVMKMSDIIQQENNLPYKINDFLLTNKEKSFYNSLKPITDKYEYIILSKMRIADIVSVTANNNEYMKWFNKINKKHIDFIVCNKEFRPLLLIEIDDYTHDRPDRIERDKFVDEIFRNRHIKLIHLRQWKTEELESIIINSIVSQQTTSNPNT